MRSVKRIENGILTACTFLAAALWIFPLYWAFITSLRSEERVVSDGAGILPDEFNLTSYGDILWNTNLVNWYINSIGTAIIITVTVIISGMMCA
ncbi:MAG: carbohydrate ABC transporter permease, partial [Phyllobacterium sp.]